MVRVSGEGSGQRVNPTTPSLCNGRRRQCLRRLQCHRPGYRQVVQDAYVTLIGLAHGSSGAKRLVAQFIPKFFTHFPTLYEKALDALLDLCEDEELVIRTVTIKNLPSLVKNSRDLLLKITDVLTQLLQAEDSEELNTVRQALLAVIRLDPKGSIMMIFGSSLKQKDLREKTLEFLAADLMPLRGELFAKNDGLEKLFAEEIKKVLNDVNSSEFSILVQMLLKLQLYEKNVAARQELVDALIAQLPTETFDPSDEDAIRKVLACAKVVIPILESGVSSATLLTFFINRILPPDRFSRVADKQKTSILRPFVDCLRLAGPKEEGVKVMVPHVKQLLLDNVALPSPNAADSITAAEEVKIDFSRVECIAFACYLTSMRVPEAMNGEELAARFRVLYQASQNNVSKLKTALSVHKQQKEAEELLKQPRLRNKLILHPSWKAPLPPPKAVPAPNPAPTPIKSTPAPQDAKRKATETGQQQQQQPLLKKAKQQQPTPTGLGGAKQQGRNNQSHSGANSNANTKHQQQQQQQQQQLAAVPVKVDQKLYVPPAARGA
ncbi:apoptosis inhibitory protein 5-domain-containing protein, partial [Jimgerdemannia flammicorona]